MNKEEAIMILQNIKPTPHRADSKSTTHILQTIALEMAIKALEQEPILDKIRAEIMDFCKRSNITCDSSISACLDIIDKYRKEQE